MLYAPVNPQPPRGRLLVVDEVGIAAILVANFRLRGFDVVLLDIDGFQVHMRMRASEVAAPVLFLSARQSIEDKVRGFTVVGDDYLAKPFDIREP